MEIGFDNLLLVELIKVTRRLTDWSALAVRITMNALIVVLSRLVISDSKCIQYVSY